MRVLLQLALVALLLACAAPAPARAGGYGRGKPHRLGLYPREQWYLNHSPAPANGPLPEAWDWSNVNGTSYLTASWNQHIPRYCGSCFAHATLSMVQDRMKLKKLRAGDTTPDVMLGRQTFLNCGPFKGYSLGCDGGEPLEVFKYMAEEGLPDESCNHYSATDYTLFKKHGRTECPQAAVCVNCMPDEKHPDDYECWPIKKPVVYKVSAYGKLEAGEEAMQREILARGPIVCGIACPDVFTWQYHSSKHGGVFIDNSGDTELDHDVEVVGWGVDEESGLKFWHVRNSWGTYWGELGFFKVQRGVPGGGALQIESGDCWYAEPAYQGEDAVVDGEYEGSMDGLKRPKSHKGKHPHKDSKAKQQQQQQQQQTVAVAAAQRAVVAAAAAKAAEREGGVVRAVATACGAALARVRTAFAGVAVQ